MEVDAFCLFVFLDCIHSNRAENKTGPVVEILKGAANWESRLADLHRFQHSRVFQLVQNDVWIKLVGFLSRATQHTAALGVNRASRDLKVASETVGKK